MKRDEGLGSETGLEIDRYNAPNASWKQEGPSPFVQPLASRHHPEIESRLNGDARQWRAIDTHQLYLWTWIRATMDPMKRIIIVRFLSLPGSLSLSLYISPSALPKTRSPSRKVRTEIAAGVIDRPSYQPQDSCSTPEEYSGPGVRTIDRKVGGTSCRDNRFSSPPRGRTYVPSRYECRIDTSDR